MKIETSSLTKVYRFGPSRIKAVDNVDMKIAESSFTAIIGPSGSGKTTLLNLLGLNDYPTSGKILIGNVETSHLSGRQRRRLRLLHMGFIFQTFNLLPTLNALENVEVPMALAGKTSKDQRLKATRLLEDVGLGERLNHRAKELSMGEMQRVAIARALANDPEVIIADEPTGELDSGTAKEIIGLLSDVNRSRNATVVVATHDEKIVEAAHMLYMIEDGKVREVRLSRHNKEKSVD